MTKPVGRVDQTRLATKLIFKLESDVVAAEHIIVCSRSACQPDREQAHFSKVSLIRTNDGLRTS
jgi:hypothetical protein